jgi:hypothetical protein
VDYADAEAEGDPIEAEGDPTEAEGDPTEAVEAEVAAVTMEEAAAADDQHQNGTAEAAASMEAIAPATEEELRWGCLSPL